MKDPPPPAEIYKRRRITLAPIITKCFDETINSEDTPQVTQIRMPTSPSTSQDKTSMAPDSGHEEISRWSSTTEDSGSDCFELELESEFDYEELKEDKLKRYRRFFNNRPLMRHLDTNENQLLADLLFERLLSEVQQPSLPFKKATSDYRGEMQARAFWDDVRAELQFDEGFLENEWPEGYPQASDGLETSL